MFHDRIALWTILLVGAISCSQLHAEYVESIDTTDVNGYGIDSSFGVRNSQSYGEELIIYLKNDIVMQYSTRPAVSKGYLNCSFDDLKIVPDTIRGQPYPSVCRLNSVFIIQSIKDSTFAKVQFIKKMEDGRYIYKYGRNTLPNNKLFVNLVYDRTQRYKPNNLFNGLSGDYHYPATSWFDTLYWEPPLPNNNHLIGYILYATDWRKNPAIDTSKPIDISQWDSIAFYPAITKKAKLDHARVNICYVNLVAIYEEGKSEFLDGWTILEAIPANTARPEHLYSAFHQKATTTPIPGGINISIPLHSAESPYSLSFYRPDGTLHSRISGLHKNNFILKTEGDRFPAGLYLVHAEFSDGNIVTRTFAVTR